MRNKKSGAGAFAKVFALLITLVIVSFGVLANFINEKTQRHTVLSIDKVENTEGDSEGFSTRIYYIVSTDRGAYHVRTAGFNAAPECAGIKVDSTYLLTTRGISVPFIGVYECIIKVQ